MPTFAVRCVEPRAVPFNIGEGVGKRGKARAASYEVALGGAAMLSKLIRSAQLQSRN